MKGKLGWTLGAGLALAVSTVPASAQVRIDVGVHTPNVGARVSIGGPRVVVARPPVYRVGPPVVIRQDRGRRGRGWGGPPGLAVARERHYQNALRKAEKNYYKSIRRAQKNYEKDVRRYERSRRR